MENHIPNFGEYGYVEPNKIAKISSSWNWPIIALGSVFIALAACVIYSIINQKVEKKHEEVKIAEDRIPDKKRAI